MSDATTTTVAKPGTACLGCRRRKLKCSREQEGCLNCLKAELPCVYPTPEIGVKRKRGPYKKDKPARDRHLADLVKYLDPGTSASSASPDATDLAARSRPWPAASPRHHHNGDSVSTTDASPGARPPDRRTTLSEDLVKDALIALTKSSVTTRESHSEQSHNACPGQTAVPDRTVSAVLPGALHPPIPRLMDYWHLFTARVDPLIKLIHCPTLAKRIFTHMHNIDAIGPSTSLLLASIYYAAVNSCTATEVRHRFGESRDALMERYARFIENSLADNYDAPQVEHLQAVVIYMSVFRRKESGSNVSTLFALAVCMAQILGIDRDSDQPLTPFDTQMRRRLWWHICGLESRAAEEGGARTTSIMETRTVTFPDNLHDADLDPQATEPPQPRLGVTSMTYTLGRWSIIRLIRALWKIKKRYAANDPEAMKAEQNQVFEEHKARIDADFFQHMHESRPADWMCLRYMKAMLVKARIIIDHPLGQVPKKGTTKEERHRLLRASVDIIRLTHVLSSDRRIQDWLWYFRGYMQWHALAVVVAELGQSNNKQFTHSAWAVVEPMLANWDNTYNTKAGEPAWDHVNDLIQRAREMRTRAEAPRNNATPTMSNPPDTPVYNIVRPASVGHIMSPPTSISPMNQNYSYGTYTTPSPHDTSQNFVHQQPVDMTGYGQQGTIYYEQSPVELPTPNFDDIDFSAFDAVFGNAAWEMPNSFEFNMNMT